MCQLFIKDHDDDDVAVYAKVRTTGAYDQITKQPVHGRKKGGGIRLGEMERDSIISHGAAYLLHDRLFNCSDGAEVGPQRVK